MELVITRTDGRIQRIKQAEAVRYGNNGRRLTDTQLNKKLHITARAVGGDFYSKHKIVF